MTWIKSFQFYFSSCAIKKPLAVFTSITDNVLLWILNHFNLVFSFSNPDGTKLLCCSYKQSFLFLLEASAMTDSMGVSTFHSAWCPKQTLLEDLPFLLLSHMAHQLRISFNLLLFLIYVTSLILIIPVSRSTLTAGKCKGTYIIGCHIHLTWACTS